MLCIAFLLLCHRPLCYCSDFGTESSRDVLHFERNPFTLPLYRSGISGSLSVVTIAWYFLLNLPAWWNNPYCLLYGCFFVAPASSLKLGENPCRYFVIRCDQSSLETSQTKSIWATDGATSAKITKTLQVSLFNLILS